MQNINKLRIQHSIEHSLIGDARDAEKLPDVLEVVYPHRDLTLQESYAFIRIAERWAMYSGDYVRPDHLNDAEFYETWRM